MKPAWSAFAVLLCVGCLAFAGAAPPGDGFYLLERSGEGTVYKDAWGKEWFLGGKLDLPMQDKRINSQNNDNTEFYLNLAVPYDEQIHSRIYGLLISGILYRNTGTGSSSNVSASIGFRIDGEEHAKRIADFLQIPVGYRQRPNCALTATFTPARPEFERGEMVTAALRIVNEGPAAISFEVGGMNRGSRDNQYAFTAQLDGEPVPDVGSDSHMGGLAFPRVLKPGEAFEATADLNDWFAFDQPGRYRIHGSFQVALRPPERTFETPILWEEAPAADFTVDIAEAVETADPETSETMETFLTRMGKRLNCYFSVEDIGKPGVMNNPTLIASVSPPPPDAIQSVDDLLLFLTNQVSLVWKGRKIPLEASARERDGATIVALSDVGLRHYPWYLQDRFLDFDYEGTLNGLVDALAEKYPRLQRCTAGGMDGGIIQAEGRTPAKVHVADTLIRDILSQAVPLDGYRRILWQSRAMGAGSDLTVEMEYNGRETDVWSVR